MLTELAPYAIIMPRYTSTLTAPRLSAFYEFFVFVDKYSLVKHTWYDFYYKSVSR